MSRDSGANLGSAKDGEPLKIVIEKKNETPLLFLRPRRESV
jgi:hypothetical protein